MIYVGLVDSIVTGFYTVNIHGQTKCDEIVSNGGIMINTFVWSVISKWYKARFVGVLSDSDYTLSDFEEIERSIQPPSPVEKSPVEKLQEKTIIQDELIKITMMATDEIFVMIAPLLASQPTTMSFMNKRSGKEVSPMVDMYVAMVMMGLKTIDEVPTRYREQVKAILAQLEK